MMNIFMNELFVIWSLIIRTCYQSKLFEFLQMDIRKPIDLWTDTYEWSPEDRKNLENYTELERCDVAAEFSNNISVLANEYMLKVVHDDYRSGVSSLNIKPAVIQAWYLSLKLFEFSPFLQDFNEKAGQMMSSGILKNWNIIKLPDTLVVSNVIEDIGPQVLTMDHLEVAFLVCCVPLVLSVVAFVMELLKSRFDSWTERLSRQQRK